MNHSHTISEDDLNILARTIYGEARGEYAKYGIAAFIGVANVVMNRWRFSHQRFGRTLKEVCLKPWQFSCWNPKDPNYKILSAPLKDFIFHQCVKSAENVALHGWPDLTQGSDHYHHYSITPYWAHPSQQTVRIGSHVFYNLNV